MATVIMAPKKYGNTVMGPTVYSVLIYIYMPALTPVHYCHLNSFDRNNKILVQNHFYTYFRQMLMKRNLMNLEEVH